MIMAYCANLTLFMAILASFFFIITEIKNKSINYSSHIICLLSILLFADLVIVFVTSNYHIENVVLNSHHLKPLIYKIAGTWGSHEGSLILIYMMTAVNYFVFARFTNTTKVQRLIFFSISAFLSSYIFISSNPFRIIRDEVNAGMGLNPILQDYALAIHPPILYVGYTSLVIPLLMCFNTPEEFENQRKYLKKWSIFSWSFLTLGIGLGSWWAYRELGWGGFWFWDPVENISLLPWFVSTGLIHVLIPRDRKFYRYQILLAVLGFFYANFATFIVRSGLLTSIHSFAEDSSRGIFLLLYVITIGVIGFIPVSKAFKGNNYVQNHKMLLLQGIFMLIGSTIVLFAIIAPIIYYIIYKKFISLGGPYYEKTLLPIMSPILLLAAITSTRYKTYGYILKKIAVVTMLSSILSFLIATHYTLSHITVIYGIFIACFLLIFSTLDFLNNTRRISLFLAHFGFALLILSATIAFNASTYVEKSLKIGQSFKHNNLNIKLLDIQYGITANYAKRTAVISVEKDGYITYLHPETRLYPVEQTATTDVDIKSFLLEDIYIAFADYNEKSGAFIRVYDRKMISFIWVSVILMFSSGMLRFFRSLGSLK